MKSSVRAFLAFLAFLVASAPVQAAIEVAFIDPGDYTDASIRNGPFSSTGFGTISGLRAHIMRLGNQYLSPKENLRIEVLDVDLAGRYEWWRFPFDARIMSDSTWPAIKVRYVYIVNGKKVDEGEEHITDQNYLLRAGAGASGDSLKYEKAMLDRWFRTHFGDQAATKK